MTTFMQDNARISRLSCLTVQQRDDAFQCQRVWVNYLGIYGRCRDLSGSWVPVEDDQGRMHAVLANDVEAAEEDAPPQPDDPTDRL
jgi:hypothetical protein